MIIHIVYGSGRCGLSDALITDGDTHQRSFVVASYVVVRYDMPLKGHKKGKCVTYCGHTALEMQTSGLSYLAISSCTQKQVKSIGHIS